MESDRPLFTSNFGQPAVSVTAGTDSNQRFLVVQLPDLPGPTEIVGVSGGVAGAD
jgi:hypothetical protein